ncbi:uncharacterized protein LOC578116 [Strongylocentrotus purpuratus]|uniref:RING-type domain-containing protein n=1 Tax=Strongylocentrotus purpuratus TaxID=7668 RepID=A0A7M7NRI4_STRPU|nr:uncharacterized protein LOC578116 [Strongylocentrotus purpuratus]
METIQNNVAQNLMAMFPMRPAELILECVTHPRNCYEPVDEGTLLNRCMDDLLSREDAPNDDAQVDSFQKPLQDDIMDDIVDDFMIDDIPDGDPVVFDDKEVILNAIPNLQDLDVEPELPDMSRKNDIPVVIDLTDDTDSPTTEGKEDVITGTELSSTYKSVSSTRAESLVCLSKTTVNNDIDETYAELPDVLGFSVQPCTPYPLKTKSPNEAVPTVAAASFDNPAPSTTLGEAAARKSSPSLWNQVANAVPSVSGNVNLNGIKVCDLDSPGFQSKANAQDRNATPCSTGMSFTSSLSTAPFSAHSRPPVDTTFCVRKFPGQELGTLCQTASNSSIGVCATSTVSAGGKFNSHSRPVIINGRVVLKPAEEQKVPKLQIREGRNGHYSVVGSSTPRALTLRKELERKRAIPATLSRAPSDEIKSGTLVPPPASASRGFPINNPYTPKIEIKEEVVFPKCMFQNTDDKDGPNKASFTKIAGSTGIPLKLSTPSGTKLHFKAATLSRAPSDNALRPATTTHQVSSSTNSKSTKNLQISRTSSGSAVTPKQGERIKPVILKSASILGNGLSQGMRAGGVRLNLPQPSLAAKVSTSLNNGILRDPILVLSSSSNAAQGMMKQSNSQHLAGSSKTFIPILPKCTFNGDVRHNSAFNVVNQRPVVSCPHTTTHSQVQIPKAVENHGLNQSNTGGVKERPPIRIDVGAGNNHAKLTQEHVFYNQQVKRFVDCMHRDPAPPLNPLLPIEPLPPLNPPVQVRPLPNPVQVYDPAEPLPKVSIPGLDPAPRPAMVPETTGATATDAGGMEAASLELENMVQLVMKMFPTADETVVRGMLIEHRNVNATCNYLLENLDVANANTPAANPVPPVIKEKEKEIDYLTLDYRKRGFIQNYGQFFNQGLNLLTNDFIKISKTSLRLVLQTVSHGSYAKTKKILEDAIQADPNIQLMMRDDTKGSFFHVEKDGRTFEMRLMKKARKPIPICNLEPMHPELKKEVVFYKKHLIDETAKSDFEVALRLNEDQYEQEGQLIECGCCCMEVTFENMIQCLEGHLFCQTCLQRYTKEAVYGQGKATLCCLEDGCDSVFPRSQLEKTLTKEILVKYDERVVEESINMADMDNLLRCPECNYAAVLDKDQKVFNCPECHKETCRNCKEPWKDHYGLECDQVKKQSTMRLSYQERMTVAKVRTCYKCATKFTKSEGCNKMTCRCGAKMCYICRQPIKDYTHFDNRAATPGQVWMPKLGEKCRLWTNSNEDDDRAVKEIENEMKAEEKAIRDRTAADLKRPNIAGIDEGGGSDAKRPRTG